VNGILYCCSLPLWEGFDEPFHYGYVETVGNLYTLPMMNRTHISEEIRRSLDAVPLSRLLSAGVPGAISFEEWARLTGEQKRSRRALSGQLTRAMQVRGDEIVNYEAQQAPLAYLAFAPLYRLLSGTSLTTRVLWLRIAATVIATFALFFGLERLAVTFGVPGVFRLLAIAVVFEEQMLWASLAHIGNDVVSIPLTVWCFTWLAVTAGNATARNVLVLSAIFAAGLLTKAYFLAFAPVLAGFAAWLILTRKISLKTAVAAALLVLAVDGPWYVRNIVLYHSLSGTQQSVVGIGWAQVLGAIPKIDWLRSVTDFAMWSLWTGNWSFLSFSKITLSMEVLLLVGTAGTYITPLRARITSSECWVLLGCGAFAGALVYQTCVTWVHTHGESTHPEPWYGQGAIGVLVVLCCKGLSRSGVAGRGIGAALSLITAWILTMTYIAKLLPYYGAAVTRSNFRAIWSFWSSHPSRELGMVLPAPIPVIYFLLVSLLLLLVALTARLVTQVMRSNFDYSVRANG